MWWSGLKRAVRTHTFRLTATYIGIIMLMSVGFSAIFYNTSSRQLGRQLPPRSMVNQSGGQIAPPSQEINDFLEQRIAEGRQELLNRLITLNIAALVTGSIVSYALARRQLEPIEAAMEAQTQFVSDASHELRTPLTALQVTNEVALRRPKMSKAEVDDLLRHNIDEAVSLRDLSNALLGLVKPADTSSLQPVALQTVVTEAINHVISAAQARSVTIEETVPDIAAKAHAGALEQVLVILLDNAVKYGRDGGFITVQAIRKAKHVVITVADDGPGIDAADQPHVFERFYRADKSRGSEGYGLGLAIAKRVIEQQHGHISVASSPTGTTFTLKLLTA